MGLEHSSVVGAPLDEVFDWHTRPGAITRLTPPWQPLSVVTEAGSVRDGRAVLALPGGFRIAARHDPNGYDPPHRFVDELSSLPLGARLRWRHSHEFEAETASTTRVVDRIDTAIPAPLLDATLRFRHRQLADDLAAHHRVRQHGTEKLTVAVTGSSGLVGTALTALLTGGGHQVIRLVRHPARTPDERHWWPGNPAKELLDGVDAVIHLAGASIASRFTDAHMRAVRDSRVEPTRKLAELASRSGAGTFVSASAIAYYGSDRGDEVLTETSKPGGGFLADVVTAWESATAPVEAEGLRVVRVRTGIVQTPAGGSLGVLYPLFAAGLGGRLAGGSQWNSWIGIDDLVDVYHQALVDSSLSGPINAVAPNPVTNEEYSHTLARVLHRPCLLPVPALALRVLLGGEGFRETAEASRRVQPQRLLDGGHVFRHPDLEAALRHNLGRVPHDDQTATQLAT